MSFPVIYFAGAEDLDYFGNSGSCSISTSTGFRGGGLSRCSLQVNNSPGSYWKNLKAYSVTSFWMGTYCQFGGPNPSTGYLHWGMFDAAGVMRLQMYGVNGGTWILYKVNSVGTATQLGSNFTIPYTGSTDKFDFHINYAASGGFVEIWINGFRCFNFTGDPTTDGQTLLSNHALGCGVAGNSGINSYWSEVLLSDSDTRSMSLQTCAPVANGNTHNFDIGTPAAANVNEIVISDATLDGASAAGLIDQYTIPAMASGSYAVVAFAISARLMRGFGGPSKMDLGVRSGGGDYWSADQTLNFSFTSGYQNIWNTDPATLTAWSALPANIGLLAVA